MSIISISVLGNNHMKNIKTNRVVLITGESSGFGLEMAKLFIANGDIVCGLSTHEFEMENVYHQVGDISKEEDCHRIVKNIIDKYGRINVLMNNAGFGIFSPIEETTLEKAKRQMDVTFFGSFLMAKEVLPYMRKQGGKIINTSSIGSLIPLPFQAFYSASKASMDTLFDALRAEVYPYKIQICSLKPGDAKTEFTKKRQSGLLSSFSPYQKAFEHCLKSVSKDEQNGTSARKIAYKAFKISKRKKMPYSKKIGFKDSFLSCIYYLLPKRIRNYLLYKIYAE